MNALHIELIPSVIFRSRQDQYASVVARRLGDRCQINRVTREYEDAEDYVWWTAELEKEVPIGTFGENLTLSSFGTTSLRVGDRLRINTVLLEITFPRIPCATLGARMGNVEFVKQFIQAKHSGVYARVLEDGELQAGDSVDIVSTPNNFPMVIELYDLWHAKERDSELLERGLAAPIAERARTAFQFWLKHT